MLTLGILGSTRGSNLAPLLQRLEALGIPARVRLVVSNKASAGILDQAQALHLPHRLIPSQGRSREDFEKALHAAFEEHKVELIVLIGFMRILTPAFVLQWRNRIINVHPSLLPAFAGLMDMEIHRAVLQQELTESGCSVHLVSEGVDEGPILLQKRCAVYPEDSPESLKQRIQSLEVEALAEAIQNFIKEPPMTHRSIQRALISVSNKNGIIELAQTLDQQGIEIISTGGTASLLREKGIAVKDVSEITAFPEMMDGRVKTLHPKIHGAILGKRDKHAAIAAEHDIEWIDLVVVNLYPFAQAIASDPDNIDNAIENIDIGGPAMIRSAAKNLQDVAVVVDPADYQAIGETIRQHGTLPLNQRQKLAQKAFAHTAAYDAMIADYLARQWETALPFPPKIQLELDKITSLRYGENPQQRACAYRLNDDKHSLLDASQHQGKELSYNNLVDATAAYECVQEFDSNACVIVKHANPCGVAIADSISNAYVKALAADAKSAFGGIIAFNQSCDGKTAQAICEGFFELVIAPAFSEDALELFKGKTNMRVLEHGKNSVVNPVRYQHLQGLMLAQEIDQQTLQASDLNTVTQRQPTAEQLIEMQFAWRVVKHVKSNAIVLSKDQQTIGIGPGQVSRVDAVEIAIRKAHDPHGAVLASDAFFPFKDSIEAIAKAGIIAIIQPGGSIRDEEVIQACNQHNITMVFTGRRCFRH